MRKIIIIFIVIVFLNLIYKHFFKKKIKGILGEHKVSKFLKKQEGILYNNLCFKTKYTTCQIDHILMTKKGIFVIETKNYSGTINNASEYKEKWNHFVGHQINKVDSPYLQNEVHIKRLKEIFGNLHFFNFVVFTKPFFDLRTTSGKILKFRNFKKTIKKSYKELPDLYNIKQLNSFKNTLDNYLKENSISITEHIKNIRSKSL